MGVSLWAGKKADELIKAVWAISGSYDIHSVSSIVAALRGGHGEDIPNGSVFKETHETYGDIYFVTRRHNVEKVSGDPERPTITIQSLYLLSSNGGTSAALFQYDRPEAFAKVAEAIPAETVCKFNITTAYSSWAAGTYHFTATGTIAARAKLCLSINAGTALPGAYVRVYDSAKATMHSAQYVITAGDGGATVDLGAFGTTANHAQRVSSGNNNEANSNIFQWLNGDSGDGYMDSIFVEKNDYDMMDTSFVSKKGFLGGFSDEFRSYLGLAHIHNITNGVYENSGYSVNSEYDHNGYFWLPSRKEIYGTNENTNEDSETQLPYYAEIGTADADKLMYAEKATSPTSYWLRTPHASTAHAVRICSSGYGGALYNHNASYANGVAPLAILA